MVKGSLTFPRWRYRQLRTAAERLRKRGRSYKEIRKKVPVSKSTLSKWCRDIPLTKAQITRLGALYDTQLRGAKANQRKSKDKKESVRAKAISEISEPNLKTWKAIGAMLYWSEGNKLSGTAITNSDPSFIVFFVKWLQKVLNIPPAQLTAYLHLHQGQNDREEKLFWSKLTGIPFQNFRKTFYKPRGTGHRRNILYHGTIRIRIYGAGSELLRYQILGWAEAIAQRMVSQKVINIHYRGRMGR